MSNITHADLESAGFRSYQTSRSEADSCWQRAEYNAEGQKMYFVNVEEWKSPLPGEDIIDWIVEVQMYPEELDDFYGVKLKFCCRTGGELEKVEAFVRHLYFHNKCRPDIHNN